MARAFSTTEDQAILLWLSFVVEDAPPRTLDEAFDRVEFRLEALAGPLRRTDFMINRRVRVLKSRSAGRPRVSRFPRKYPCYRCGVEMRQEHAGVRHCDPCRAILNGVSPYAPDCGGDQDDGE